LTPGWGRAMHVLSLEKKILLAFVVGGLLLLCAGWFAAESGRAYLAADAQADSLRDAERALLAVELSLRGAESGQRGYLLTGRHEYLGPYERALQDIGGQLDVTRGLLAEQAEALQLFWKVDALVRFKLAELQHTIELRRESGFDSGLRLLGTEVGVLDMGEIRVQIGQIQKLLQAKVNAELARSAQRSSYTQVGVLLTGGVAAGLAVAAYMFIAWDLRERRQLAARVEEQANRDPLTQLANRRFFEKCLEFSLAQARRDGTHLGLLFLDLDGFKAVNDRHGHERGDAALVEIARRFRETVRDADLLGRLGGDEFALIAPNAKDGRELAHLAQRLLRTLVDPNQPALSDRALGASIGIAFFPADAADLQGLIAAADAAMYAAKRAGKNRIAFSRTSVAAAA
jgi:diguanylate cyclase (GGDEF)-like protein